MRVVKTIGEMKTLSQSLRTEGRTISFVPTMGWLHRGHTALIERAREVSDVVVVSIFVNPAQFGPGEDYESYPRDIERDLRICREEGVDVVFVPSVEEMYPQGFSTYVTVEGLSERLCGVSRPGHFRGVTTVVAKLFNTVMPHKALFGLKDYQQQLIVKKMVRELNMDVEIITVETVRDEDGLALSSRNNYLSPAEREVARLIPESLKRAKELVEEGVSESARIIEEMKKVMDRKPGIVVDYINVCHPQTLEDVERVEDEALVALAVWVGRARLIDNLLIKKQQGGS